MREQADYRGLDADDLERCWATYREDPDACDGIPEDLLPFDYKERAAVRSSEGPQAEWPEAGRANQLPREGDHPYVPPKDSHGEPKRLPGDQGFVDDKGQIWTWDYSEHGGGHWDVVDPVTKDHMSIFPDGHERGS